MSIHQQGCSCNVINPSSVETTNQGSLLNDYINAIFDCNEVNLLVVGNNEYENGANEIAFCKNSWAALLNGRVSGRYLLCALGVNFQNVVNNESVSPIELFCELARRGIVFINQKDVSSSPYVSAITDKGSPKILLLCGTPAINKSFSLSRMFRVLEICRIIHAIHPDIENSNSGVFSEIFQKRRRDAWFECWGEYGKAIDYMKSNVPSCQSAQNILNDIDEIYSITSSLWHCAMHTT